jgi:hypothetical protein
MAIKGSIKPLSAVPIKSVKSRRRRRRRIFVVKNLVFNAII